MLQGVLRQRTAGSLKIKLSQLQGRLAEKQAGFYACCTYPCSSLAAATWPPTRAQAMAVRPCNNSQPKG